MTIKHFQGYGCVHAKVVSKTKGKDFAGVDCTIIKIKVQGNHEWGLRVNGSIDVYNWLLKRFDKSVGKWNEVWISDWKTESSFATNEKTGETEDVCVYTIFYYKLTR